jgi:hypothetical protein
MILQENKSIIQMLVANPVPARRTEAGVPGQKCLFKSLEKSLKSLFLLPV